MKKTMWEWKINLRCFICQADDEVYYKDNPLGNSKPCDTMMYTDKQGNLKAGLICEECFKKLKEE